MGGFKTQRMKENSAVQKAHKMAQAFATHRNKEFLKRFIDAAEIPKLIKLTADECRESGKEITEKEIKEFLETDPQVDLHFGMAVALAYAMGYSDHARGASLRQLYVPDELTDKPSEKSPIILTDEDKDKQLILPGIE